MSESYLISMRNLVSCVLIQFVGVAVAFGQHQDVTNQKMVGVWQRGTNTIASGWGDCYLFYPDHSFRFYFRQTEFKENEIIGVRGRYGIKGDSIYFLPAAIEEMVGANRKVFNQEDPDEQAATFGEFDETVHSVSIGGVRYYKMRDKPDQYFGK